MLENGLLFDVVFIWRGLYYEVVAMWSFTVHV